MIVKRIFDIYQEKWFLEEVYDDLFEWNRWWLKSRCKDGYLCWGSHKTGLAKADPAENSHLGAMYECGLDNSPMYSDVPFNKNTHLLELADVGLMSLFITDCKALAYISKKIGKADNCNLLLKSASDMTALLSGLWDDKKGTYLNYRTDTKQKSEVISPTNLYPLLTGDIPQKHSAEMIRKCYFNPDVFWGDFVIPSISKENPEFSKQDYWKGRIWAPMNMLVYLGIMNYDLPEARTDLAEKSKKLLLNNWRTSNAVFENYMVTGEGRNKTEPMNNSDSFYHWGALLGYINLIN
jgi:neutral trehalase